ncbi:PucR family transcriptional regulator [Bacillus sp. 1P06AnD]|uniref:PucR family transcriptional regulator n=1 Tax=Bacillus sp. 1P06AnD TaxID=3132208 RepID=UPI0039A1ABC9
MVALKQLIQLPECKELTLVAGEKGLERPINGINVTESVELSHFYRPNELMVTTGILFERDERKLLHMIQEACRKDTVGIVLNIGPYISEIPETALRFADEHHYPVFQLPWTYRIADFIKTTLSFLSSYPSLSTPAEDLVSSILFNDPPANECTIPELLKAGFIPGSQMAIMVWTCDKPDIPIQAYKGYIDNELARRYPLFLSTKSKNQLIYLMKADDTIHLDNTISSSILSVQEDTRFIHPSASLRAGIGSEYTVFQKMRKSYEEAMHVIRLQQHEHCQSIYTYSGSGAYKLLLSIDNKSLLIDFHEELLGPLKRYDSLHDTKLVAFLRIYLQENGSTSNIGKRTFIHRNTVLYKLKKIESLLGFHLAEPSAQMNLSLAFMIEDLMS